MPFAFMLFILELNPIDEILRILTRILPVKEAHSVNGHLYSINFIEVNSVKALNHVAVQVIRNLPFHRSSQLLHVLNALPKLIATPGN